MVVDTKETVFSILRDHDEEIRTLEVRRLGLFGSFARGEPNEAT